MSKPPNIRKGYRKKRVVRPREKDTEPGYDSHWEYKLHSGPLSEWDIHKTKIDYVVQEAIIVIKDIFRKYPNRYESIIKDLCENLKALDNAEARAAMIWIIG